MGQSFLSSHNPNARATLKPSVSTLRRTVAIYTDYSNAKSSLPFVPISLKYLGLEVRYSGTVPCGSVHPSAIPGLHIRILTYKYFLLCDVRLSVNIYLHAKLFRSISEFRTFPVLQYCVSQTFQHPDNFQTTGGYD
jgi:hypothetical protein